MHRVIHLSITLHHAMTNLITEFRISTGGVGVWYLCNFKRLDKDPVKELFAHRNLMKLRYVNKRRSEH